MNRSERGKTRHRANSCLNGFTIIELLVSVTVVSVLLGILIPAVQAARERARHTQCQNNLRQILLAFHQHEETFKVLPVPQVEMESWGIRILPFIEKQKPVTASNGKQDQIIADAGLFACPSDSHARGSVTNLYGKTYFANDGHGGSRNDGLFSTDDHRPLSTRDIVDGLSNTAAISERLAVPIDEDIAYENEQYWKNRVVRKTSTFTEDFESFLIVCDTLSVPPSISQYFPDAYNHIALPNRRSCTNGDRSDPRAYKYAAISPSSMHNGGVLLAYADGAVRLIADTIDLGVWRALGTRNCGD